MADQIERTESGEDAIFLGGSGAWHQKGQIIPAEVTHAEEAMRLAHLDWEVECVPMFAEPHGAADDQDNLIVVEGFKMIRRVTDGSIFGVGSETFTPFQNVTGFKILESVVGDAVCFHSAASLYGGRKIMISAKVRQDLLIAGETFHNYIVLVNGHDGTRGLSVYATSVRTVCDNTVRLGEGIAQREGSIFWAKHTPSISEIEKWGPQIIRAEIGLLDKLKETGEKLAKVKMSQREVDAFLRKLVPFVTVPDELGEKRDSALARKVKNDELRSLISMIHSEKPDLENIRGTRWGVFQAITDVDTHHTKSRQSDDARAERLATGAGDTGLVRRAVPLLLAGV